MYIIILFFVLWFLITWILSRSNIDGCNLAFFVSLIACIIVLSIIYPRPNITYFKEIKELQKIEGQYITKQGDEYILKWDNTLNVVPDKYFVLDFSEDSSYFEIEYKKTIIPEENIQRWMPGKQVNDTTIKASRYILYKKMKLLDN